MDDGVGVYLSAFVRWMIELMLCYFYSLHNNIALAGIWSELLGSYGDYCATINHLYFKFNESYNHFVARN